MTGKKSEKINKNKIIYFLKILKITILKLERNYELYALLFDIFPRKHYFLCINGL